MPSGWTPDKLEQLHRAAREELSRPPKIAVVGETGVGKSTTLNAMFNAGLPTDHVMACTRIEAGLEIDMSKVSGAKGSIIVYDMPGLGEDLDTDEKHKQTYARVLAECDVALWILDGSSRTFTQTQLALRDVVGVAMGNLERLVIGINKIDKIPPETWVDDYNLPSKEQEQSIKIKIQDVLKKIGKVCSIEKERIIPYSAQKWYRLDDLFGAMLMACPEERAWVLYDRAALADFIQKVNPEILRSLKKSS